MPPGIGYSGMPMQDPKKKKKPSKLRDNMLKGKK
jgi:hypothetical protein